MQPSQVGAIIRYRHFTATHGMPGRSSLIKFFFFFRAEDGIRYLVRSRGLGDVYKRQAGRNGIFATLHQAKQVGRTRFNGEIIHLVIEQNSRAFGCDASAKPAIKRVGDGDSITCVIHN